MVVCKNVIDAKGLVRTLVRTVALALVRTVALTLVRTESVQPCAHHCAHHIFCMCIGHKVCTSYTLLRTLVHTFVRTLVRTMAWQNLVRTMPVADVHRIGCYTPMNRTRCAQGGLFFKGPYVFSLIVLHCRYWIVL